MPTQVFTPTWRAKLNASRSSAGGAVEDLVAGLGRGRGGQVAAHDLRPEVIPFEEGRAAKDVIAGFRRRITPVAAQRVHVAGRVAELDLAAVPNVAAPGQSTR